MEKEMMTQVVEGGCPFAQKTGMHVDKVADDGTVVLVLKENDSNLNAFGVVHAGAMCGLAETAGGMAIFRYLDPRETIVLNTVLNIRFRKMPRGELTCTARVLEEEAEALMEEFKESGRADKSLDLKVRDGEGEIVAEAQASFRLMPMPAELLESLGRR